jgi:hypothetical protein
LPRKISRRNKGVIRLISLGLHITDKCNAHCRHCAYGCRPDIKGAMTLDEARGYLRQVAEHPLEVVCISGGEPFLCYEVLLGTIKAAREMGIPGIWAFTNGYWATSIEAARQRLLPLKKAGMTRLSLSADAFHQEFIPLERVRNALFVARELGLELELDVRFLEPPEEENPTNLATEEIITSLGDLTSVMVHKGQPLYIGRAAEELSHLVEQKAGIPEERCEGIWSVGTLEEPEGVSVDQYGYVSLCPGLSIGNAKEEPLGEILARYDSWEHPIIRHLTAGGPVRLAEMVRELGFVPRESYVNRCHLCYDVRKYLRPHYPHLLAPRDCYPRRGSDHDYPGDTAFLHL